MLWEWIQSKLETIKDNPRILVRDPLDLLREAEGKIHEFARANGYTVIIAATNLAFRELFERAIADPDTRKLLFIDRTPAARLSKISLAKAPPTFYPDLIADIPSDCRLDLDLRQFLIEKTGDTAWPSDANEPQFARLIINHLPGTLEAHRNLRIAQSTRFTDNDFKTIVAFAALGVAKSAFKKLKNRDYWQIGLIEHDALEELESIVPEITTPIRDELKKAPAPFCYFIDYDPALVTRAFYLSAILAQHTPNCGLLLANLDPNLKPLSNIQPEVLKQSAADLITANLEQSRRFLEDTEQSLSAEALKLLLIDHLKVTTPSGFASIIEKERYSSLVQSLALLLALENLLSPKPPWNEHQKILTVLSTYEKGPDIILSDRSSARSTLIRCYKLVIKIRELLNELSNFIKVLKISQVHQLSFKTFWEVWNNKKVNRLEYYISALERQTSSSELLPRSANELPEEFSKSLDQIKDRVTQLSYEAERQIQQVNKSFQDMVQAQYPTWVEKESEVHFTSQFLKRCLRPHWDPKTEKAVILIFDGMRYDIWDEFVKPLFEEHMEILADLPASSLLPSETGFTRKAISAGTFPDSFDSAEGEDRLLKEGLSREFGYKGNVEVVTPEGAGTGEVVHYHADNLDVYIFELCDKELHKIDAKKSEGGRVVPSRPLSFIYEQHIKNIIDTEVMAIVRRLTLGTKVFVVADHGFCKVGRDALWFNENDLDERADCNYLNCYLKVPIESADLPPKIRSSILAFTPNQLRVPSKEIRKGKIKEQTFQKNYKAVVFPKVGYSFRRPGANYNPDAFSHGGASIQELLIPMVVLRMKPRGAGVNFHSISGPKEVLEGQEVELRLHFSRSKATEKASESEPTDLRTDIEASYAYGEERRQLPRQVLFLGIGEKEVSYCFSFDTNDISLEERRIGIAERVINVTASYNDGGRLMRKSQTHRLSIRLRLDKVIRRVPPQLGTILGLTPKTMK